ncbi:cytochrome b/b6 domain-containing protein [Enterovirga rhinocerotis]|uniref:Cytochrome b n=1 Tax=Enterovirga rhinocerotis TaxID=1339210 RepID=A0A4R7C8U1_9HYPH|nr:cytochrome b/b6 domain-containing protein [Enterovirga rhinocerotis]TDR94402.1 cytochrome b [Enterovirga rhinocerotis]
MSAAPRRTASGARHSVRAWDGPTRLFKWALVASVAIGYLTYQIGDAALTWHIWNGYAALILVTFRILWGFAGSSTARFGAWITWPWSALAYGGALVTGRARRYLGHNPLGGWMIVVLLLFVAAQAISGLFTVDSNGISGGPFANLDFGDPTPVQRTLSRWHHQGFYLFLGFAVVHVVVNLLYEGVKRDPLVRAMVTGRKPAADYADQPEMVPASHVWLRALVCLVLAAAIVFGTVASFGGKLPF